MSVLESQGFGKAMLKEAVAQVESPPRGPGDQGTENKIFKELPRRLEQRAQAEL